MHSFPVLALTLFEVHENQVGKRPYYYINKISLNYFLKNYRMLVHVEIINLLSLGHYDKGEAG